MSDTTDVTSDVSTGAEGAEAGATRRRARSGTGLSSMLLPELQSLAASLGISGTARMRKGELVTAIQERQAGESRPAAAAAPRAARAARTETPEAEWPSATEVTEAPAPARSPRRATRAAGPPEPRTVREDTAAEAVAEKPAAAEPAAEHHGVALRRTARASAERCRS
ncbi:Rho termination factor N-terminal domain-containing protein, partial [Dactylosporangium sp. NPDC005572]|uniref:Rho termination factor N-terminal domain-containing protein n=1 Tax=Dactylosporangium sp. NPDC005572 TaxID=3156889 RepID=UPI0033BC7C7F